jgi:hypothetical protein
MSTTSRSRAAARVVAAVVTFPFVAPAQVPGPALGAETGVYSESYGITGREARRPAQTTRVYASPTFSWMGLEVGTNLMWSTESEFTAQSINRYYLNPRWSWGQVHAGDYTPSMSRFTAYATRIRGGGVELNPGRLRFAVAAGQAQEATDLTVFDAAPRRLMYSGLVGYGDPAGTFIELSALRAVDDSAGADSVSVAPQENAVAALAGGFGIGRVRFKGDVSASLFSRDVRASELDSTSQPSAGEGAFTPRLSSRFDQAWSAESRVTFGRGSVSARLEHVGPGFTTLGNPYLSNDRREARLSANLRLLGGRLSTVGAAGLRYDNLAGEKRGTTYRRTGSLMATLVSGQRLVSSASVLVNGLTLNPAPLPPGTPDPGAIDSFRLRNITFAVTLLEQVRFGPHTVALTIASQHLDDASPRFGDVLDATSSTVNLDWSVVALRELQFSLRPGYQRFSTVAGAESFSSVGFAIARRVPKSAWNASVAGTWTQVDEGSQWRQDASFGYRLTERDQLGAQVRYTSVRGVAEPFTETLASLRLTRRW